MLDQAAVNYGHMCINQHRHQLESAQQCIKAARQCSDRGAAIGLLDTARLCIINAEKWRASYQNWCETRHLADMIYIEAEYDEDGIPF